MLSTPRATIPKGTAETMSQPPKVVPKMHFKCRNTPYGKDEDKVRFPVPDDKVSWSVTYPDYQPLNYTHPKILSASYADPDVTVDKSVKLKYNEIDDRNDRTSFNGIYEVKDGVPLNPAGRTGMIGRGGLGRWGPNHAADPIVTRWKLNEKGEKMLHEKSKKNILQFVAIQRHDTKEWAIPGGMVDSGESFTATLKREFSEEAMNSMKASTEELSQIKKKVEENFKHGELVYSGYVDDPRNTDNAWMETVAVNFHDEAGDSLAKFQLHAGDDAIGVRWTDIDSSLSLYASHRDFIKVAAEMNNAHW